MGDVGQLVAAFEAGTLLRPSPDTLNIVDLSRALAGLAGADNVQQTPGSTKISELIGATQHLVFMLADGLGMNLIEELLEHNFLKENLLGELQTVFPSASAVALTSLATGEWPGRHGITGWWTHLPEFRMAAAVLPFVERTNGRSLRTLGVAVEQALPVPSLMAAMKRETWALFPERMAGGVYSVYFSGGKDRFGYSSLRKAVDLTAARIAAADAPTFTYIYAPRVDSEAHACGIRRPEVWTAIREVEREVQRLAEGLDGRGRVVISADHGMLDATSTQKHQLRPSEGALASLRFPPSGDARVLYFHVHEGACEHTRQRLEQSLGDHFFIITGGEAEDLGLFGPGPISAFARDRLGDLIAISKGADVVEYIAIGGPSRVMSQTSHHSGLTPDEMRIPLVVA